MFIIKSQLEAQNLRNRKRFALVKLAYRFSAEVESGCELRVITCIVMKGTKHHE